MMKTKRFLSLLLTLLLLAPAFAGCGEKTPTDVPDTAPDTTTAAPASGETVTTEPEPTVLDAVPVLDFGGASFRTIAQPGMMDFYTEEETGEIVNDAVFARNRAAEERFSHRHRADERGELQYDFLHHHRRGAERLGRL